MADRIRPVHSSSRSRTRAPTLQFGRSFNLLLPEGLDHEFVMKPSAPSESAQRNPGRADDRLRIGRLLTLISSADTRSSIPGEIAQPKRQGGACVELFHCPVSARSSQKIPFFCPGTDTPDSSFRPGT